MKKTFWIFLIGISMLLFQCGKEYSMKEDCAKVEGGTAYIDKCGDCVGGTTGKISFCTADCAGVYGGTAYKDNCNECVGGNTGKTTACVVNTKDCAGVEGGKAYLDKCNVCVEGTTGKTDCSKIEKNYGNGVTDIDGNQYKSIIIGTQEWMTENLKVTKYNDGTAIDVVSNETTWLTNGNTAKICYYNWDNQNKEKYGALYNVYTISGDKKVCPSGWHLPSEEEVSILFKYAGNDGNKLSIKADWQGMGMVIGTAETDAYGFSAIPSKQYPFTTLPGGMSNRNYFWTSTKSNEFTYKAAEISSTVTKITTKSTEGISIRCIKD